MRDLRSISNRHDPTTFGICSVAAAVIAASTAVNAGVQIYSANKAASAQTKAANQANQTLKDQQAQVRTDLQPYRDGGGADFTKYNQLVGGGGNPGQQQAILQSLPGYQFTLGQGLKSVQNGASARGLGVSGAALKGAAGYANGLAQSNYGTYANQLFQGAGLGENAAAQTGNLGTQSAMGQASNITGAGNAQAAAAIASGNAVSNGLNNLYLYNALQNGGQGGLYGSGSSGKYSGGPLASDGTYG